MDKPKVGILSMQRVINYGSFLQAYALKQLLKKNGAGEVYFVDVEPGPILVDQPTANKSSFLRYAEKVCQLVKRGKIISGYKTFLFQKKVAKSIISAWPQLGLETKPKYPLDLIVIGSDEVFNCCQDVTWGYSTQLFGNIPATVAHRIVSYAGSFGHTDLSLLKHYGIETEVADNFRKLESVSVRDENSAQIVNQLIGIEPHIHVDPVLAYSYEKEIAAFNEKPEKNPYIIIYSYQGRINDKNEVYEICQYAKCHNLKLISIFSRYDWCDESVVPDSPIQILQWFKFAEGVVTDTFHGTIFSIITRSKFVTILRPSNTNKLGYLLRCLYLDNVANDAKDISKILIKSPDYQKTFDVLKKQKDITDKYICEILNKC